MRTSRKSQVAGRKSAAQSGLPVQTFPALPALPAFSRAARTLAFAVALLASGAARAAAQDVHVLVVTGVGGDEEHSTQFQKWAGAVVDSAKKHGVLAGNIAWLAEAPDKDPRISARSSRDGVTKAFTDLAAKAKANDEIVVVLKQGGFQGWICSEYEGNRWVEDAQQVQSVEQVRRQHRMLCRLLDEPIPPALQAS